MLKILNQFNFHFYQSIYEIIIKCEYILKYYIINLIDLKLIDKPIILLFLCILKC